MLVLKLKAPNNPGKQRSLLNLLKFLKQNTLYHVKYFYFAKGGQGNCGRVRGMYGTTWIKIL